MCPENICAGMIITIDGPAGAGKSTVARAVALKLNLPYLNTGAIYRAVSWWLNNKGISPEKEDEIAREMKDFSLSLDGGRVSVFGRDITEDIRSPEIDSIVSPYAALMCVRDAMMDVQRSQGKNGLVADGRDMGTVVFPDADLKVFLTAEAEERARRRYAERIAKGEKADYNETLDTVQKRDFYDMNREIAPLRPAAGCVVLDCTNMTADEVVDAITSLASKICESK